MFALTSGEEKILRFQFRTSSSRGGRRYSPFVFTGQGVAMLSSVLRSSHAIQVNLAIMRTFVQVREMISTHEELRRKIEATEKRYDARFQSIFAAIRQMLETPIPPKRQIGFHTDATVVRAKPSRIAYL
jgi:hypothetical protein